MSRIIWRHKNFEISTGWDQSLQCHFLTVEDRNSEEEEPVFDNLTLANFRMSVDQIAKVLESLQIPFPDPIRKELDVHRIYDIGNCVCFFQFDEKEGIWQKKS